MRDNVQLDRILGFMMEADKLKAVKRTGWVISGIRDPEHVGDHSYGTALLAYVFAKRMGLDADRCAAMGIIHDINEVITGDIAIRLDKKKQKIPDAVKRRLQRRNELKMLSYLGSPDRRHFRGLLDELYECKTREARLVKQVDKLEWVIQLVAYHKRMSKDRINEFIVNAEQKIDIPELLYILNKVKPQVSR